MMGGCTHGDTKLKKVSEMEVCKRGLVYIQSLVEQGDLPAEGCEQCMIDWLCDDPMEHCMNIEDTNQRWEQCVRNSDFWVGMLESAWNNTSWHKLVTTTPWYDDMVESMLALMTKYGLKIKLV
jgi:hypothetical protein